MQMLEWVSFWCGNHSEARFSYSKNNVRFTSYRDSRLSRSLSRLPVYLFRCNHFLWSGCCCRLLRLLAVPHASSTNNSDSSGGSSLGGLSPLNDSCTLDPCHQGTCPILTLFESPAISKHVAGQACDAHKNVFTRLILHLCESVSSSSRPSFGFRVHTL